MTKYENPKHCTEIEYARSILEAEAKAVLGVIPLLDENFTAAVKLILSTRGRVVLTGMGKMGIIAQKISATLASTGTPSLYLHPAEALHGDLGRVVQEDVVLALSNSGETEEVLRLIPPIKKIGAKIIAMTGNLNSPLAKYSDIVLNIGKVNEACPLGLAPSASTTAMLALGDALSLTVLKLRGFDKEKFAMFHPAGELGRILMKVREIMRTGERDAIVRKDATVKEVLLKVTASRVGAATVIDNTGRICGIFTDGDLRRHLEKNPNLIDEKIENVMTRNPATISPDALATEALRILREKKIDELPVVDECGRPIGRVDVQDLLDVGIV